MPIRPNPLETLREQIADGAENRLLSNRGADGAADPSTRPADAQRAEAARENLVKWVQALGLSKQESAQLLSHVFYGSQRSGGDIEQAAQCVADFAAAKARSRGAAASERSATTDTGPPDAAKLRGRIESLRQELLNERRLAEEAATLQDWLQVAEAFLADGAQDEARVTLNCVEQAIRIGVGFS